MKLMFSESLRKIVATTIIILGLASVTVSIGAEVFGIGDQVNFGLVQLMLVIGGIIAIIFGIILLLSVIKPSWFNFSDAAKQEILLVDTTLERLFFIILISIWFGLAFGFGEVIIQAYHTLAGKRIFVGVNYIWMTPIVDVILLLIINLLFFLFSLRMGKGKFLKFLLIINFSVGLLSWLYLFSGLHRIAIWVLAVGLGIQASRIALKHSSSFYWFLRRTIIIPMLLLVLTVLGLFGWRQYTTQKALHALPSLTKPYPNIILIVLDTVRSQNMSMYGYDRSTTPFLESFAQSGILFENAFSPSSWTFPSHASMFTGRYPHELNDSWTEPLPDRYPSLAGFLRGQGYHTMGFSANLNHVSWEEKLDRGFLKFEGYPISFGQFVISSALLRRAVCYLGHGETCAFFKWLGIEPAVGRKNAAHLNEEVLSYVRGIDRKRPFYLFMNYFDAHEPHVAPNGNFILPDQGSKQQSMLSMVGLSQQEKMKEYIDGYDAQIYYLDNHLKALFDELDAINLLDNTIVIITSDHGQEFMEHGEFGHGTNLYTTTTRIPLLISFPEKIMPGKRISQVVSTKDIPATIVDIIGLPEDSPFPGVSLRSLWDESLQVDYLAKNYPVSETSVDANWDDVGTMVSVIDGNNHYIQNVDGKEELFSLTDIWETDNLLDRMENIPNIETFRHWVEKIFRK